jgi:PAS domain S-box-containing protein
MKRFSEDDLQTFLELDSTLRATLDSDLRIQASTGGWSALLEIQPQEIEETLFKSLVHEDDWPGLETILTSQSGDSPRFRVVSTSGKHHWVRGTFHHQNNKWYLVAHLTTSSKADPNPLLNLISSLDDFIFTMDLDGKFVDYHLPSGRKLFRTPPEFVGKNYKDVLPDDVAHLMSTAIKSVREGGHAERVEYSLEMDGDVEWYEAKISPLVDTTGNIDGFISVVRDSTQRKSAELTLNATQQLYQLLASNLAGVGAVLLDRDFRALLVEGQAISILGYDRDDIIGKTPEDLFSKAQVRWIKRSYSNVFEGETIEFTHYYRDNVFAARLLPLQDHALLIMVDVTDIEETRRELEDTIQRDQLLYRTSQALLSASDLESALTILSDGVVELLRSDRSSITLFDPETREFVHEVRGGTEDTVTPAMDANTFWNGIGGWVVNQGVPTLSSKKDPDPRETQEIQLQRRRSQVGALAFSPIRVNDEIVGVIGAANSIQSPDFTQEDLDLLTIIGTQTGLVLEKLFVLQKLQESEENYRQLVENATEIVFRADAEGNLIYVNQVAERITGYPLDELIGKHYQQFIRPDHRDAFHEAAVAAIKAHQEALYSEYPLLTKNNDTVWLGQNHRFYYQDGRFAGTQGVARDITQRKVAELEREQLLQDLEAFSHTVAHDLKSPLAILIGYSEILSEMLDLTEDEHRMFKHVLRASHQMRRIIDELLKFASLQRQYEIDFEPIDMRQVVDITLDRMMYEIEKYKATIRLPENFPPALGYAPWIEEIWANYISNAIKYGGRPPIVTIGAEIVPDGMVRYWVQDNGRGIELEDQDKLFREFIRLGKIRVKGSGLGLSICKRIARHLGGDVGLESTIDQGSIFWFKLPKA